MRLRNAGLLWLCTAGLLCAQFPGPYPDPFPREPPRSRGDRGPGGRLPAPANVLQQFTGKIDKIENDSITIRVPDSRLITFTCSKITKYFEHDKEIQRAALKPGDEVEVEARSDNEGYFHAVNVKLEKAVEPLATETAPEEVPAQKHEAIVIGSAAAKDPDVPILRRGKPAPRPHPAEDEPENGPAAAASPAAPPATAASAAWSESDSFLEKAREVANEFSETLPNYICNQLTTRYESEGRPVSWRALDVVSAAVAYEDGVESYHDIRINNKPVNKAMDQIPGSRSYGEFGNTLRGVFSPASAADFHLRRDSTASGRPATIYDFEVEQPNSHWQTTVGGQSVLPAYKGSVWIDKITSRVLRIEMQALNVPETFPLDTIEWVVDYSFVRIGDTEFLLPAHVENLSCWRGTLRCGRNALDFRNYRKFTSESTITTSDSTVRFEAEEHPEPATANK